MAQLSEIRRVAGDAGLAVLAPDAAYVPDEGAPELVATTVGNYSPERNRFVVLQLQRCRPVRAGRRILRRCHHGNSS